MLRVGIFTPYNRNETTIAATSFADWLKKCGINVSILSSTKPQTGIHLFWDSNVKQLNEKAVYKWAYNCNYLFWFVPDAKRLQQSYLVTFNNQKRKTKIGFVPGWTDWSMGSDAFLAQAEKTFCFNREIYLWLKSFRPANNILSSCRVHTTLITSDIAVTPKPSVKDPGKIRILAYLPKETEIDLGGAFVDVLENALKGNDHLILDVLAERSFSSTYRRKLKALSSTYSHRCSYQHSLPYWRYIQLAKNADWVYIANTRFQFGSTFSLFAASTTPFICHAVPPASSYVSNGLNGILISCKYLSSPFPIADVQPDKILEALNLAANYKADEICKLQLTNFALLQQRQKAFERFIYSEVVGV